LPDRRKRFPVNLAERRDLNNGFGNALSRAVELTLTPLIMAFLGHLLDRWLGTGMAFALFLGLFTLFYVSWRMFSGYSEKMQAEEDRVLKRNRERPA
jgi:hypothetical protein